MKCSSCGVELSDQDSFCRECGAKVKKDVCVCGAAKPSPDVLYCTNCGKLFISFSEKEINRLEEYLLKTGNEYIQLQQKYNALKEKTEAKETKKQTEVANSYIKGMEDLYSALEDYGVDFDEVGVLLSAVESENLELVNFLLDSGVDVDVRDSDNNTPLLIACREGYNKIAKALVDAGADVDAENDYDETPLYLARDNGNRYLVGLLRKAGAYEEDDD